MQKNSDVSSEKHLDIPARPEALTYVAAVTAVVFLLSLMGFTYVVGLDKPNHLGSFFLLWLREILLLAFFALLLAAALIAWLARRLMRTVRRNET